MSRPVFGVRVQVTLNTYSSDAASTIVTTPTEGAELTLDQITKLIGMLRNAQATIRRDNRA